MSYSSMIDHLIYNFKSNPNSNNIDYKKSLTPDHKIQGLRRMREILLGIKFNLSNNYNANTWMELLKTQHPKTGISLLEYSIMADLSELTQQFVQDGIQEYFNKSTQKAKKKRKKFGKYGTIIMAAGALAIILAPFTAGSSTVLITIATVGVSAIISAIGFIQVTRMNQENDEFNIQQSKINLQFKLCSYFIKEIDKQLKKYEYKPEYDESLNFLKQEFALNAKPENSILHQLRLVSENNYFSDNEDSESLDYDTLLKPNMGNN